jgi:nucleoside-diphosphate-sugar epimerase
VPGRRVLITGIASYLGSELARRLEADPPTARLVYELSERVRDVIQQRVYANLVRRGPAFL